MKSENYVKKLEIKKATGLDNLPSKMVTTGTGIVARSLALLSNQWTTKRISFCGKMEDIYLQRFIFNKSSSLFFNLGMAYFGSGLLSVIKTRTYCQLF